MVIHQKDIASLAQPLIIKSIRICKDMIKDAGVNAGDIEKMILVGGPTIAPYFRDLLSDPKEGLGIPLEYSVDPLTVVALGAAIFAGTQLIDRSVALPEDVGTFNLSLEYLPIGSDSEPTVGGIVTHSEIDEFTGYSLEITTLNYNSGRIPLSPNGSFIKNIMAQSGNQNIYKIELFDKTGTKKKLNPEKFTYTIGNTPSNPILTHSIGVALLNNGVEWFIKKGTSLPKEKMYFADWSLGE